MRFTKPGRWHFTDAELDWLATHAYTNALASDILSRYNRRYGKQGTRWSDFRYKLVHKHTWH